MICCFTVNSFLNMSLPTAGMVIGWISTVLSLMQAGVYVKINEVIGFITLEMEYRKPFVGVIDSGLPILLTLSLLDVIVCVLLIIGIVKKSHLLMLPWLINNGISLFFKLLLGFILIALLTSIPLNENNDSPVIWIIFLILTIMVFMCMVWNAVYSLFQSIRKDNERVIFDAERLVGNSNPASYELFKNPE